jgi:uncharacterized protein DUF6162
VPRLLSRLPGSTAEAADLRTVEVVPPSAGDEGTWAFFGAMFILLCAIYAVAFERGGKVSDAAASGPAVLAYQVLFRDLPSPEQRIFRAMQEGALEAIAVRGSGKAWPSVETMAADGVAPFAPDPLDRSGLRWTLRHDELLYQYIGIPSDARAPSFMIFALEPEPTTGEKAVPGIVDEEHQLLPDGTLLHVTYWKRIGASMPQSLVWDPALEGWTQIRVTSLVEELEKRQ